MTSFSANGEKVYFCPSTPSSVWPLCCSLQLPATWLGVAKLKQTLCFSPLKGLGHTLQDCKIFPNYFERNEENELNVTLNSLKRGQYSASNIHMQTCMVVLIFKKNKLT